MSHPNPPEDVPILPKPTEEETKSGGSYIPVPTHKKPRILTIDPSHCYASYDDHGIEEKKDAIEFVMEALTDPKLCLTTKTSTANNCGCYLQFCPREREEPKVDTSASAEADADTYEPAELIIIDPEVDMELAIEAICKFCRLDVPHQRQYVGILDEKSKALGPRRKKNNREMFLAPGYENGTEHYAVLICRARFFGILAYSKYKFKTALDKYTELRDLKPMETLLDWPSSTLRQRLELDPFTLASLQYKQGLPVIRKFDGGMPIVQGLGTKNPQRLTPLEYANFVVKAREKEADPPVDDSKTMFRPAFKKRAKRLTNFGKEDKKDTSDNRLPVGHDYYPIQFVKKKTATEKLYPNWKKHDQLEMLAHGDHGTLLDLCVDFDDDTMGNFLNIVREDALYRTKGHVQFVVRALKACVQFKRHTRAEWAAERKKWAAEWKVMNQTKVPAFNEENWTKLTKQKLTKCVIEKWMEICKKNTGQTQRQDEMRALANDLEQEYPLMFEHVLNAASFHDQTEKQDMLSMYLQHTDTVDSFVLFHQLYGLSFNFVAVPGSSDQAHVEHNYQCQAYQDYKVGLDDMERAKLENMEADFLKEAKLLRLNHIRIYKLEAAERLCFDAYTYLHMTVIPARKDQPGNVRRVLTVHHGLYKK